MGALPCSGHTIPPLPYGTLPPSQKPDSNVVVGVQRNWGVASADPVSHEILRLVPKLSPASVVPKQGYPAECPNALTLNRLAFGSARLT